MGTSDRAGSRSSALILDKRLLPEIAGDAEDSIFCGPVADPLGADSPSETGRRQRAGPAMQGDGLSLSGDRAALAT